MKKLFKSLSAENFTRFIYKGVDDINYKIDAESKSILEADLSAEDIAKKEEERRDNVETQLSKITDVTDGEKDLFIDSIRGDLNNINMYGESIDDTEWREVIKNSEKSLEEIFSTRKYLDKKNEIISDVVSKITDNDTKRMQVENNLENLFAGIEKNIANNHDNIDWDDWGEISFSPKSDGAGGYEMKIDNKLWNGDTVLMSVDAGDKDIKFYKKVAKDLSSVFGDMQNVDFSELKFIEDDFLSENENLAKNEENSEKGIESNETTVEISEKIKNALNDKQTLENMDLSEFAGGYKDWREWNIGVLAHLGLLDDIVDGESEKAMDLIEEIQRQTGSFVDGRFGTQSLANLEMETGVSSGFDFSKHESHLAKMDQKTSLDEVDKFDEANLEEKKGEMLAELKKVEGMPPEIKIDNIQCPKSNYQGLVYPVKITGCDDCSYDIVAIENGDSFKYKESYGAGSYYAKSKSRKVEDLLMGSA